MFNEGNNLFGKARQVLLEPAAEGSVLLCPHRYVDFYANYNEGLNILFKDQLPGKGSNTAEVEELFPVLTVDYRVAQNLIITGRKIDAQLALFLEMAAP
ncbi:hypothetical protein D3C85_1617260 [compost metagenome]